MTRTKSTGRPERLALIRDLITNPAADELTTSLDRLRNEIADMKSEAALMRCKLAVANRRLSLSLFAHELNDTPMSRAALARDYKILHSK